MSIHCLSDACRPRHHTRQAGPADPGSGPACCHGVIFSNVRGDVAKIGDRLHLGVGATHQGFQMIRHLLPDRRAGRRAGDAMLARRNAPTDG